MSFLEPVKNVIGESIGSSVKAAIVNMTLPAVDKTVVQNQTASQMADSVGEAEEYGKLDASQGLPVKPYEFLTPAERCAYLRGYNRKREEMDSRVAKAEATMVVGIGIKWLCFGVGIGVGSIGMLKLIGYILKK